MNVLFDCEGDDSDESRERQLDLEAEEEFRELMGCGLAYDDVYSSKRQNSQDNGPEMRGSYSFSSSDEDVEDLKDALCLSPEPTSAPTEETTWDLEPPPCRASNPITKNEIFGLNGVVADADAMKTSKALIPPHEYFGEAFVDEDDEPLWSRRTAASYTPPRRRPRIKSTPNCRFWNQTEDWVQCC